MKIHFATTSIGIAALFVAALHALANPIILPQGAWSDGSGTVNVNSQQTFGQFQCGFGEGGTFPPGTTCTFSSATAIGAGDGTSLAYTDAAGIHVHTDADATGDATSQANASGFIFDTVTNKGNVALNFSITMDLHASLFTSVGAYSDFDLEYDTFGFNPLASWKKTSQGQDLGQVYDLNVTTPNVTIQPNASYLYDIVLVGDTLASSNGPACGGCKGPNGYMDASNTLSLTSFNVTDTLGNAVDPSVLKSSSGFAFGAVATPETSTILLALSGLSSIWLSRKLRVIKSGVPK